MDRLGEKGMTLKEWVPIETLNGKELTYQDEERCLYGDKNRRRRETSLRA